MNMPRKPRIRLTAPTAKVTESVAERAWGPRSGNLGRLDLVIGDQRLFAHGQFVDFVVIDQRIDVLLDHRFDSGLRQGELGDAQLLRLTARLVVLLGGALAPASGGGHGDFGR